jgi:hypothetical protein
VITVNTAVAKSPGFCYSCGKPIYVGDKIVIIEQSDKLTPDTAYHKECWKSGIKVKFT